MEAMGFAKWVSWRNEGERWWFNGERRSWQWFSGGLQWRMTEKLRKCIN